MSADATVRSQMAVTTQTTGAEAAWSGSSPNSVATSGRGVGVAIIDSGIAAHPALAGRVVVNLDFTDEARTRRRRLRSRHAHRRHRRGAVQPELGVEARRAAWRRARTCST